MCDSKAKTVYACVRHAWGSASCKQGPDCKVWFACAHGTWHTPAWLDVHISSGLKPAASERPAANNKRQKAACTRQHAGENDWQCVLHSQRHPAQDRRQGTARGQAKGNVGILHSTCCSGRCNAAVVWPGAAGNGHDEMLAQSVHRSTVLMIGLGSD